MGKPTLKNIIPEDLRSLSRLEALYAQAIAANWLQHSECNVRNFLCAAVRAARAGGRIGAVFVGIVRRGLWHHVTQEQEDHALSCLNRYRLRRGDAFLMGPKSDGSAVTSAAAKELVDGLLVRLPPIASRGGAGNVGTFQRSDCQGGAT